MPHWAIGTELPVPASALRMMAPRAVGFPWHDNSLPPSVVRMACSSLLAGGLDHLASAGQPLRTAARWKGPTVAGEAGAVPVIILP